MAKVFVVMENIYTNTTYEYYDKTRIKVFATHDLAWDYVMDKIAKSNFTYDIPTEDNPNYLFMWKDRFFPKYVRKYDGRMFKTYYIEEHEYEES